MESRTRSHCSAKTDGFENGNRRYPSSSARVDFNIKKTCLFYFRRILICDCPSGELDRVSEFASFGKIIELNYRAVDIVFEFASHVAYLLDCIPDLIRGLALIAVLDYLNAVALKVFISFKVSIECNALRLLDVEYEEGQSSFFGDPGVDLS